MKQSHGSWRIGVTPKNAQIKCICNCLYCNKPSKTKSKRDLERSPNTFCNSSCQVKWQHKNTRFNKGLNNPSYKHGERVDGKLANYGDGFNSSIKRQVKIRDGFNCQKCLVNFSGFKAKLLDVHHKDRNKYNNTLDNLVCLCKSCHTKIHWIED